MKPLDGSRIVDRDEHQQLFCDLVQCRDAARLLTIRNNSGTGRTTLLSRLKYMCAYKRLAFVSLVPLDDREITESFHLVKRLRDDLTKFGLAFPSFERWSTAWASRDTAPFIAELSRPGNGGSVYGSVNLSGAQISGGYQGGVVIAQAGSVNLTASPAPSKEEAVWPSPAWEQIARERCVKAFLEDIKEICEKGTVVLLLDSWDPDRISDELREWIQFTLLPYHCFDVDSRPKRLVIVIAGSEDLGLADLLQEKYPQLVRSHPFSTWGEREVREFVKLQGYERFMHDDEWKYLIDKFKNPDFTLENAIRFLKYLREASGPG
jgi:hypothetical protein